MVPVLRPIEFLLEVLLSDVVFVAESFSGRLKLDSSFEYLLSEAGGDGTNVQELILIESLLLNVVLVVVIVKGDWRE